MSDLYSPRVVVELDPGDWYVGPRGAEVPLVAGARGGWAFGMDFAGVWQPVGGPPVAATLRAVMDPHSEWVARWYTLAFDQEAHPFCRFNLSQVSIAYESRTTRTRARVQLPTALPPRQGRTTILCARSFTVADPIELYAVSTAPPEVAHARDY